MENKNIKIQVFGSSCPSCKKLHQSVEETVKEMGLRVEVDYIDDIQKLLDLGVMQSPVLVIDGKVVLAGPIHVREKIKSLITQALENTVKDSDENCGHSCCGCC